MKVNQIHSTSEHLSWCWIAHLASLNPNIRYPDGNVESTWPLASSSIDTINNNPTPTTTATATSYSPPEITWQEIELATIRYLIEYMQQSSWVQRNQFEPPVDTSDPAVLLGFISPGMSRFDAFIYQSGEQQHSCRFVGQGESNYCQYTNYRRQRVRAHVQSHFSYEPFLCAGACGKLEW